MPQVWLTGFADEIDPDPHKQVECLQNNGMAHIELRGVAGKNVLDLDGDEVASLRAALGRAGIAVSSIGSPIGKVDIESDLEAHFARFRLALERAVQFDAPFVRVFSFYHRDQTVADCRDRVLAQMRRMAEAAAGVDRVLLHENEKGIYGELPEACVDLVESVDSPYLRAAFDPANFVHAGVDTRRAWEMLENHTVYFHVKDALSGGRVVPAGQGDGHWPWLIERALKAGFEGFCSIEPHLKADDPEFGGDGAERFTHAVAALRRLLADAGAETG